MSNGIENYHLVIFLVVMNIFSFGVMLVDKYRSMHHGSTRISEGMIFFLATLFGSLGVYLGMFIFRHKSRKWYFLIGVPLLFLQNLSLLYIIYLYNNNYFN